MCQWVSEYEVHETFAEDEFDIETAEGAYVWTEFQNEDESFVDGGYVASNSDLRMPVVGYYVSRKPWPTNQESSDFVLTSMLLDCDDCEAMGEDDDGDECEACLGDRGIYIYFEL
jgi:hypothetical protein